MTDQQPFLVISRRGIVHATASLAEDSSTACGKGTRDLVHVGAVGIGERMCVQCARSLPEPTPAPEPDIRGGAPDFWSVACEGDGGCEAQAREKCRDETGERPYGVHAQRTVVYFSTRTAS